MNNKQVYTNSSSQKQKGKKKKKKKKKDEKLCVFPSQKAPKRTVDWTVPGRLITKVPWSKDCHRSHWLGGGKGRGCVPATQPSQILKNYDVQRTIITLVWAQRYLILFLHCS